MHLPPTVSGLPRRLACRASGGGSVFSPRRRGTGPFVPSPPIPETRANRLTAGSGAPLDAAHSPTPGEEDLAALLAAAAGGDRRAFDRAFAVLYDQLAQLARAQRRRWRGNETVNTAALLHEAYLKLAAPYAEDAGAASPRWEGRRHFFALAAQVMRHVLLNYAEAARAAKRGGDARHVPLEAAEGEALSGEEADRIVAMHEALERLAQAEPRQARIVECRFFAGLSIPETAEALEISEATVKREWKAASAWLQGELRGDAGRGG